MTDNSHHGQLSENYADWITVISAVFRDVAAPDRILLGVRRPVASSLRHPGVLSTLTMRVPGDIFIAALKEAGLANPPKFQPGDLLPLAEAPSWTLGAAEGFAHTSVFLVESLLARKAGVADALVRGELRGTLSPLGVACEVVEDPKGGHEPEATLMLTYVIDISSGVELLPEETSSYGPLAWVDGPVLDRAVRTGDALLLLPDADPWEVCLHGLCVRSAGALLSFGSAPEEH